MVGAPQAAVSRDGTRVCRRGHVGPLRSDPRPRGSIYVQSPGHEEQFPEAVR